MGSGWGGKGGRCVGLLLLLTWLISQFTFISTMALSLTHFKPHECVKVGLKRSFVDRISTGRAEHWILCTAGRVTDFSVSFPVVLIEDISLCSNSHNKTNSLLHQNTTVLYRVIKKSLCTWWLQYRKQVHRDSVITLYNYWSFGMATCFGPSFDHLQAKVLKQKATISASVYCGIPYYLQGVRETD